MFNKQLSRQSAIAVFVATCLLPLSLSTAQAQVPAQGPLLNTTGAGVAPNFMVTMDDSGSMQWRHMPETVFAGGTFVTPNPIGSNNSRIDPRDTYQWAVSTGSFGTILGRINSTSYQLKAMRSADTNTIFYNPETLYLPWMKSDGTRRANSPPAAAYLDPLITSGAVGTTVNLTSYTAPAGSSRWCQLNTTTPVPAGSFINGVQYRIVAAGTTSFTALSAANNSVGTTFTANGVGTGTGTATLTADCTSLANNQATLAHDPGVYFRLGTTTVAAGSFVNGLTYTIASLGSSGTQTNFTAVGAASNTVGLSFIATAPGTGSGTATRYQDLTVHTNYTGFSINTASATYRKVAGRTDCSGAIGPTGCTQAQERQNFANWFTYYRTRNLLARGAMMESFVGVGNTLRLGFGRINANLGGAVNVDGVPTRVIESDTTIYGGGGVRPFVQTRKNQFFRWLEDLPANGGTPLPAALGAMGEYYSRTDVRGPYTDDPSVSTNVVSTNSSCRRSYQLMMTDGYWNGAPPSVGNQDAQAGSSIPGGSFAFGANTAPYADAFSNTMADVAMRYWKQDIQPGIANNIQATGDDPSYWQAMTNYMVGLGVRGTLNPETDLPYLLLPIGHAQRKVWPQAQDGAAAANVDDLWHAALNTRGAYYSATNTAELSKAVASALVGAQSKVNSTAGVATVSSVLETGNRKYVPTYDPSNWSGNVQGQSLGANGQASAAVWNAATRVPPHASRNIVTWNSATSAAVDFKWASLSSASQTAMTSGTSNLVEFLRGDSTNEGTFAETAKPYRLRKDANGNPFVLGDIVNSNPVLIRGLFNGGYSSLPTGGTSYQAFLTAKAAREAVLFVGANDGMLHAFKDVNTSATTSTDGAEIFAFVPRTVYPGLSDLADKTYGAAVPHRFFVDGPQQEADAFVRGPGTTAGTLESTASWRNYLVGSLGAGGRAVYALDVTTSPTLDAKNVRWEISSATDSDLGYVMAPIEVGVLKSGKWVAIFGNGFSSTAGNAILFVVDLETAAITKLTVDSSGSNGLGGVGIVRNAKGEIETLYAGDLKGKVWRMDYNTPAVPFVVNGGSAFFSTTGATQPITQPPSIFDHSKGGKIIVFGTGKLFAAADVSTTTTQTIYGVWDKPSDTVSRPMSQSNLAPRAFAANVTAGLPTYFTLNSIPPGTPVNWTTERGWRVDVTNIMPGGRVIYPTQTITSKLVLVTAVAPGQSVNVCTGSDGQGADFVFDVEEGVQPTFKLFDTDGDGDVDSNDAISGGVLTKALGIRAIVRGINTGGGGGGGGGGVPICQPGYIAISIQNATGQLMTCVPQASTNATRPFDRVQRRIINPPIR